MRSVCYFCPLWTKTWKFRQTLWKFQTRNIKKIRQAGVALISDVPRNFVRGGGSTNSVEDRGQREWDLGAVVPSHGSGVPTGGVGEGVSPPKFRSFDKAVPNSQFRGKYVRNNLTSIRVSLIFFSCFMKRPLRQLSPPQWCFFLSKAWRDLSYAYVTSASQKISEKNRCCC
jgi:hypothetical protein